MISAHPDKPDIPIWASRDAFPPSPRGWGWTDAKLREHPCDSENALLDAIGSDVENRILLVWSPSHSHMIIPEELEHASHALMAARKRRLAIASSNAIDRLRWFGLLAAAAFAYTYYQAWNFAPVGLRFSEQVKFAVDELRHSHTMGLALLMFLIFAFIPWYQARKRSKAIARWQSGDDQRAIPILRFESWLDLQRAPCSRVLMAMVALVFVAQLSTRVNPSILAAGLMKDVGHSQWWRLFTAPLLHGGFIHFFMNASALLYLGRRVESFARWPHLPLVFLVSALAGGIASAKFMPHTPSVGASGGLMGWLGFLLVFESLHARLVPVSARRRLLAGIVLTGAIGLVGYKFIDNYAHVGGLIAGMAYGAIVFPKSSSAARPRITRTDLAAGTLAMAVLAASAITAIWQITHS